jgi:ABC-2 type transport system ATP-binding protein
MYLFERLSEGCIRIFIEIKHECLLIINKGTIVAQGTIKELLANMDEETFVFDLDKDPDTSLTQSLEKVHAKKDQPYTLELTLTKAYPLNDAVRDLNAKGYQVKSLRNKTNRLEEFFIRQTNKT